MNCKICFGGSVKKIWDSPIRHGGLDCYTKEPVAEYQCQDCGVIWHENVIPDIADYYESAEYRSSVSPGFGEKDYSRMGDKDDKGNKDKLFYTGTEIFENRIVSDLGCLAGAFLDCVRGAAKETVAIEPSEMGRKAMKDKGYEHIYAYAGDALRDYKNRIEVLTSFDVIEHVEDPEAFLTDVYDLLAKNGQAVIGTPTEAPVLRRLLGEAYEKQVLFSVQHIWVFSKESLEILAKRIGFSKITIKIFQMYGLDNLFGWLRDKKPNSAIGAELLGENINSAWKSHCAETGIGDYMVMYLEK